MGEIRLNRLEPLAPLFVRVEASTTIGEIRLLLDASPDVRLVVVESHHAGRTSWSFAHAHRIRYPELDAAQATPIALLPDLLTPAIALERTAQGIGEARWRAQRLVGVGVIVVVENGRFMGLVGDPEAAFTRGADTPLTESRYLRAKVEAPDAPTPLRTDSFAAGRRHDLTISIGPHQAGLLSMDSPIPAEVTAAAQMLTVTVVAPWATVTGQMYLPEEGASSDCKLDLGVPVPDASGVVRLAIMVMSTTALVQTATLVGEATESPGAPLALVTDASLWPGPADSTPTLVTDAHQVVAAVPADEGFIVSGVADMEEASRALHERLETELQGLWLDEAELRDDASVDVLRSIARAGVALREDLLERLSPESREQFAGDGPVQLVVRDPKMDVPLELFYDAATPHRSDSSLCPGALDSLRTGSCAHCGNKGSSDTICPMGFWGLRRVIERRVLDPDPQGAEPLRISASEGSARRKLAKLESALVASSDRVDADVFLEIIEALHRANIREQRAENWSAWSEAVTGAGAPTLLIAMPHVDQQGYEPRLEIGGDELERLDISAQYIKYPPEGPDEPGPVVLLLGCETASANIAHRTMMSKFLAQGASVVLGTRMPVVANVAPKIGTALIRALTDQLTGRSVSFATALLSARRSLVLDGQLVALALVAQGDGGWLIPPREETYAED